MVHAGEVPEGPPPPRPHRLPAARSIASSWSASFASWSTETPATETPHTQGRRSRGCAPSWRFTARRSSGRERFCLVGGAPALGVLSWVDPGGPERVHHRAHSSQCPQQPVRCGGPSVALAPGHLGARGRAGARGRLRRGATSPGAGARATGDVAARGRLVSRGRFLPW